MTTSAQRPRDVPAAAAKAQTQASVSAPDELRIALAQYAPVLGNRVRNQARHLELIAEARAQGAGLIVFPELSLTGYFLRDMVPDMAWPAGAAELAELAAAAGDASLVVGFVEESPSNRFYNAALLAEAGQLAHVHRKVYLPTYGLFEELRYFAAGERLRACDSSRLGRVGLLICEDFWHLSAIAVMQAEEVDVLVCVANSPGRGVGGDELATAETWRLLIRAYAQTLGAVVVFVNRVGFEDGLCFWGGSTVIGPDGRELGAAPLFDEALSIVSFDRRELRRQRILTPLARDERLLLTIEELNRIKRKRYEG